MAGGDFGARRPGIWKSRRPRVRNSARPRDRKGNAVAIGQRNSEPFPAGTAQFPGPLILRKPLFRGYNRRCRPKGMLFAIFHLAAGDWVNIRPFAVRRNDEQKNSNYE